MYMPLATADVWEIAGNFEPCRLFGCLPLICVSDDILILGSYWVQKDIAQSLMAIEIELPEGEKPFASSFDINRREYPEGRFYVFHPGESQLETLALLSRTFKGGVEKDIFFDHLLLYRSGTPLVPLLYFHDAFMGGTLYLSGHYSEKVIHLFASSLGATARLVDNPDLRIEKQASIRKEEL